MMKLKINLVLVLAILISTICFAQKAKTNKQFVITANIVGMKDGLGVKLRDVYHDRDLATAKVMNHAFQLVGNVDSPTYCTLTIGNVKPDNKKGTIISRGFQLFVENVKIKVSAANYDSIPLLSPPNKYDQILREFNVTVAGGIAEKQYIQFRHFIHNSELKSLLAWVNYYLKSPKIKDTKVKKILYDSLLAVQGNKDAAKAGFITKHPDYAISLMLMSEKLGEAFRYSNADYDSWLETFKGNYDQARYAAFVKAVQTARKFCKGAPYTDFAVQTTDSLTKNLSDYMNHKGYTVIDFWASWCGWCRKAIPQIKTMYGKYDKSKLTIISISTDKESKNWKLAMKHENMPWLQLALTKESTGVVEKAYNLYGIPDFLIINNQGKVLFATSNPAELDSMISSLL